MPSNTSPSPAMIERRERGFMYTLQRDIAASNVTVAAGTTVRIDAYYLDGLIKRDVQ